MSEYIGRQIGSYQLSRLLGQGGFASVYLGEHLYLKKQVAVKLLQVSMDAENLQSFLKEAQLIASLDHPHIIRVLDFGLDSNSSRPFFVMDYAAKGSLRRVHTRGSVLPLQTILPYVQQVASALYYAHTQKIVHCDVKPENMLLISANKIVLSDFGIAVTAHTTESISKQNVMGTALYMAPEQIRGKARPASDQYALGVVVYEWLCGMCPFEKSTSIATMMSHLMDTPPPLREKVPSIPQGVEEVVLKALAKDQQQRFTNINEFALALADVQKSTQTRLKRPPHFIPYATHSLSPPIAEASIPTEPSERTVHDPFILSADDITKHEKDLPPVLIRSKNGISRRKVVAGAITFATLSVGGFIVSKIVSGQSRVADIGLYPGKTLLVYTHHAGAIWTLGWSPDGRWIASGSVDKTIQIWDSTTGKERLTYEGHNPPASSKAFSHPGSFVEGLAWSPDGKWIASGGKEGNVHVWDATTGKLLYIYPHKDLIRPIAWSRDGQWLASAGWERTIHIYEALTGKTRLLLPGHTNDVSSLDWSQDGSMIISGSNDRTVRVWDTRNGRTISIYDGHTDAVKQAQWSPNGKWIASCGDDKLIHIWDFENKNTILTYNKHAAAVKSLAWSPHGKLIVSSSDDHTVQIWDSSSGNTLFTYRGHLQTLPVTVAIWSPDGKKVASGSYDQTVRVWEAL